MGRIFLSYMAMLSLCMALDLSRPSYQIIQSSEEILIDGVLNESVWQKGDVITELTQKDP